MLLDLLILIALVLAVFALALSVSAVGLSVPALGLGVSALGFGVSAFGVSQGGRCRLAGFRQPSLASKAGSRSCVGLSIFARMGSSDSLEGAGFLLARALDRSLGLVLGLSLVVRSGADRVVGLLRRGDSRRRR